ncbi:response regulator [Ectothiorhodospiraceae bacterium 2226]|nr:response regulator [Ectothiorhodospiraceae bacterium 2226]
MAPPRNETHLLVVEDSDDLVAIWKILFREAGFKARYASTGRAAIALVEQGFRPDVVLTDYYLPDKTGLEVIEGIRAHADTQCLMITGNKDVAFAEAAKSHGVRILHKPAKFDEIEACIQALASASHAR